MNKWPPSPLVPQGRYAPDPGPQFIEPQIGNNGAGANKRGFSDQYASGQMLPPSALDLPGDGIGITQKVVNSFAFARIIDVSIDTATNQSTLFLTTTDAYRNFLMLRNGSAVANIYIGFGNDASARSTLRMAPGAIVLFDVSVSQDDLYYFADAAAGILCFAYSTIKPDWKA